MEAIATGVCSREALEPGCGSRRAAAQRACVSIVLEFPGPRQRSTGDVRHVWRVLRPLRVAELQLSISRLHQRGLAAQASATLPSPLLERSFRRSAEIRKARGRTAFSA